MRASPTYLQWITDVFGSAIGFIQAEGLECWKPAASAFVID